MEIMEIRGKNSNMYHTYSSWGSKSGVTEPHETNAYSHEGPNFEVVNLNGIEKAIFQQYTGAWWHSRLASCHGLSIGHSQAPANLSLIRSWLHSGIKVKPVSLFCARFPR